MRPACWPGSPYSPQSRTHAKGLGEDHHDRLTEVFSTRTVKQLRPICLGAAANKVFARMLLERTKPSLKYSGPSQNLGKGRQTVDYIWVISRLMPLDQEWKCGLYFLKLDVEQAFDSLHRGKFLSRLGSKMGCCEELRCWWDLLKHTEAELFTAWGQSIIPTTSGIRQGSVESPQVFATDMDWIMADTQGKWNRDSTKDFFEGLQFAEAAFMDDCLLQNGNKRVLEGRVCQLIDEPGNGVSASTQRNARPM